MQEQEITSDAMIATGCSTRVAKVHNKPSEAFEITFEYNGFNHRSIVALEPMAAIALYKQLKRLLTE